MNNNSEPVKTIIKHNKYLDFYKTYKSKDTEFWGIGIENESYLMFENKIKVTKDFIQNNHNKERYSINYFANYKKDNLKNALNNLPDEIEVPIYLNAYLFQNTDFNGEPKKIYSKKNEDNPKFSGQSIDDALQKNSFIKFLFEKNMIYDGDTIEFVTNDFYKTNVVSVIDELRFIKSNFIKEVNKFVDEKCILNDKIVYPDYNYGFVKYLTNMNNIGICNNATYHINITLPTKVFRNRIINMKEFNNVHSNAIRAIQWLEPFLLALYGTPDILSSLDESYSKGSLRLMLSRYIGLGTYDTKKMKIGKQLNDFDYSHNYFKELHQDSPYNPPDKIGYDINFHKFKNHGIELRIFDYFPEDYLEDIMNFIILLCAYSQCEYVENPLDNDEWINFTKDCIKNGSKAKVNSNLYNKLKEMFEISECCFSELFSCNKERKVLDVIKMISKKLYNTYKDCSLCFKMSPNMKKIKFINYNKIIRDKYKNLLQKV